MMYDLTDLEDSLVTFHPIFKKLVWIMKDEKDGQDINMWTYRWEWSWGIQDHKIYFDLP